MLIGQLFVESQKGINSVKSIKGIVFVVLCICNHKSNVGNELSILLALYAFFMQITVSS